MPPIRTGLSDEKTFPLVSDDGTGTQRWLLVIGQDGTATHPLPRSGEVTVGRADHNTVRIPDLSISRAHAAIDPGPPVRVRDLGSHNGVRVGQRRLAPNEWAEVALGEIFQLGSVMLAVQESAAGVPPVPPSTVRTDASSVPRATVPPSPPVIPASAHTRPGGALPPPAPPAALRNSPLGDDIVVQDPAMRQLYELVARVAPGAISLLLLGETGVGKEVVAEAVHRLSPRASRPFLRLNCAALSETLLESELFGHEKGAFTGAPAAKPGLLETADGGTVFLDEVGELPPSLQVKLLRVLEERKVLRVGGLAPRPIDVRFVAATNRDLRAEVARGTFRQDLYFRLNGISLVIPPLRARTGEVETLARRFAARAAAESGLPPNAVPTFDADVLAVFARYPWPGNVRELRNVVERAVLLAGAGGTIARGHLPFELLEPQPAVTPVDPGRVSAVPAQPPPPPPAAASGGALKSELEALERRRILDALEKCSGNQTRAARMLGMTRGTFLARLDAYGIPRPRKGAGDE